MAIITITVKPYNNFTIGPLDLLQLAPHLAQKPACTLEAIPLLNIGCHISPQQRMRRTDTPDRIDTGVEAP